MLSISLNVYICGFCKKRSGLSEIFEAFLKIFDERLELCLLFALSVNDLFRRAGNEVFVCKLCVLPVELLFGVCKLFFHACALFFKINKLCHGHEHARVIGYDGHHTVGALGKLRSDLNAGGIGQLADKLLAVGECLCLVGDDDKVALSGRGNVHLGSRAHERP